MFNLFARLSKRDRYPHIIKDMNGEELKDFLEVLDAFKHVAEQDDQVLSPSVSMTSSVSPSPRTPRMSMDALSQLGFDDLLHPEDVGQPLPPARFSQERVVTPRRPKLDEEGTTPPTKSTNPLGQRQCMVKTKEEVDEHKPHQKMQADTSKEHKVDEAIDEEEANESDESSEDSILTEARQFARQGSKAIPSKWMKSAVKKINKDIKKKKKAQKQAQKEAHKAAKLAKAKRKSGKQPGKEPSTSIPVKKAIAKDSSKSSKGPEYDKPKHNLTAQITKTVLRQSHQHNPRTYMQARTVDMDPGSKRLILITEITEKQSPHHWELMQQVQ